MRMILAVGITIIDPRNSSAAMRRIAHKVAAGWVVIGLVCVAIGAGLLVWAEQRVRTFPPPPEKVVEAAAFTPAALSGPFEEVRLSGLARLDQLALVGTDELVQLRAEGVVPFVGPDWQPGEPISVLLHFTFLSRVPELASNIVAERLGATPGSGPEIEITTLMRQTDLLFPRGSVTESLRAEGLVVTDDVVLVVPFDEAYRDVQIASSVRPARRSARFIIWMGGLLAALGVFGRRRSILPATL